MIHRRDIAVTLAIHLWEVKLVSVKQPENGVAHPQYAKWKVIRLIPFRKIYSMYSMAQLFRANDVVT